MTDAKPLRVVSFNDGLPVSGVSSWELRLAAAIAADGAFGVDWRCVEVGPADRLAAFARVVPAALKSRFAFVVKRPAENRWAVARRVVRQCPALAEADVLLPNHCDEGWLAAALLRDRPGRGPAVVGILHSDTDRFYAFCGRGKVTGLDAVVAVSRQCQDRYAEYNPGCPAVAYVPYGVPAAAAPPQVPAGPPLRIAYFGRLEVAQKRVLDLIPLAEALVRAGADFALDVAGDGGAAAALREGLTRTAGRRVTFHGPLPLERVPAFLSGRHVFLSVSAFEGTSIAMLEAMGQGLAPVVTDVSGVADAIEPGRSGWVQRVGDLDGFAARLTALAGNPADAVRAGRAAWETVRDRYTVAASVSGLAAILRAAAAGPREPFAIVRGHAALGVFDRRWLPNPLAAALRRSFKAILGRSN